MSKSTTTLLVAAATAGSALAATTSARAENRRICVEISLQRSARKAASPPRPGPLAPYAAPPPAAPTQDPPNANPSPSPNPAPNPTLKPALPDKPPPEADSAVVTPGSELDVLPRDAADKLGAGEGLPLGQRPLAYMKRLIEHFVSHEKGFTAVQSGCEHTIHVELYPLVSGWTVFARYTGTGREERVDRLLPNELSQFAERAVTSLLYGRPISATINRENVLLSDSKEYAQRVRGTSHFIMGVGTQLRAGRFGTAIGNSEDPRKGEAVEAYRFFSPVSAFLGYRGRFESWGLETTVMGGMGTSKTSSTKNPGGGHVDFTADAGMQLHFLHYFDPRGLTSFYLGAGSTFELLLFQVIKPAGQRQDGTRSYLPGGGVDVDLVMGWEFMRASTAQFFLQTEAQLPAYLLSNENDAGGLHTWFPAMAFKLAVMF